MIFFFFMSILFSKFQLRSQIGNLENLGADYLVYADNMYRGRQIDFCIAFASRWSKRSLSPDDALGPGANGAELLVALEHGEGGVPDLDAVEVTLVFTHPASQSGPPALSANKSPTRASTQTPKSTRFIWAAESLPVKLSTVAVGAGHGSCCWSLPAAAAAAFIFSGATL